MNAQNSKSSSILARRLISGGAAILVAAMLLCRLPSDVGAAESLQARVKRSLLGLYIHGVTEEIAKAEVGARGVPVLLQLLADPRFPRRDNVVAFLTHLAGEESVQALLDLLGDPPAAVTIPEEDRALLLTPQALGHIAGRGSARALEALLQITAPGSNGGLLGGAAARGPDPAGLRDDLIEMSLRGLAFTGAQTARARLARIASGQETPTPGGRGMNDAAAAALALFDQRATPLADSTIDESAASVAGAFDTQSVVHDHGLSYANHVNVTNPMTDARLDLLLDGGSLRVGRSDFSTDVACCATMTRSNTQRTFGSSTDGLDIIDNNSELNSVLNNGTARVKVVRAINYCGGSGTNIIGCAWVGGNGMTLVRMSGSGSETVLWVHEYGHNVGLSHNSDSRYIMHGVDYGTNNAMSQAECDRFHSPSSRAYATISQTGACTDSDGDGVQDGIDNCPGVANSDQADADGDGIGDVCQASSCGNGVIDAGEQCDGADLGGQTCQSRGFTGGTLSCNSNCTFNASACYVCGNGVLDPGEQCDGISLGGATCQSRGFTGGTLSCNSNCTFNASACYSCGNGVRETGEQCDGANLGGATCADNHCSGGTPTCTSNCVISYASCTGCSVCALRGAGCVSNSECCSNSCKGKRGAKRCK